MQYGGELLVSRSTSQSTDSLNNGANETQAVTTEQSRKGAIYEDLIVSGKVIRDVIYSTRENVQIVHEVFRQVMKLSIRTYLLIQRETVWFGPETVVVTRGEPEGYNRLFHTAASTRACCLVIGCSISSDKTAS